MIEDIRHALSILFAPDKVVELRALSKSGLTRSGYFKSQENLARTAEELDKSGDFKGIYVVLNEINPDAYGQNPERIATNPKTTRDADITRRIWLPVDLDSIRESGTSSTDEEHELAISRAKEIQECMRDMGWPEPILGDSGNGAHLLWKIDLPNDNTSRNLISNCLRVISKMFSDDKIEVDTSVGNASRIWKLYGTCARKGENTPDRPWRYSKILEVPDEIKVVTRLQIANLVKSIEVSPDHKYSTTEYKKIDIGAWIKSHELKVWRIKETPQFTLYVLENCPMNPAHNDRSAFFIQWNSGDVYFKCHHNHCKDFGFSDVLEKFGEKLEVDVGDGKTLSLSDVTVPRSSNPNELRFSPSKAAGAILSMYSIITDEAGTMWIYEDGIYSKNVDNIVDKIMNRVAGDLYSRYQNRELIRKIQTETFRFNMKWDPNPFLFGVENGVVNLETGELLEYSPDMYITMKSPIRYDPNAKCPNIINYFRTTFKTEGDILTIIDLFVMLSCVKPKDAFLYLVGPGGNGKKILEKLFEAYVGSKQFTKVRIEDLSKQFAKTALIGKRLLLNTEASGGVITTEWIKQISTGDGITTDVKYKDQADFVPYCLIVVDSNLPHKFLDTSKGMERRFYKTDMPYLFVDNPDPNNPKERKKDPYLEEKVKSPEELSGLLNIVIKRAPEVIYKWEAYRSKAGSDLLEEYNLQSYSMSSFIEKFMIRDVSHGFTSFSDIYDAYQRYCDSINVGTDTKRALSAEIQRHFGIDPRSTTIAGRRIRGFDQVYVIEDELTDFVAERNNYSRLTNEEVRQIVCNLLECDPITKDSIQSGVTVQVPVEDKPEIPVQSNTMYSSFSGERGKIQSEVRKVISEYEKMEKISFHLT